MSATQVKYRHGTTAEHAIFTGVSAEMTVDTDKNTLVVHDGSTAGGFPLALETSVNAVKTDVSVIQTSVSAHSTAISVLQTSVSATNTLVSVLQTSVAALNTQSNTLAPIANLTWAANTVPYFTGVSSADITDFSVVGRTLVGQSTQALMRTTGLGLGTMATAASSDYLAVANNLSDVNSATLARSSLGPDGLGSPLNARLEVTAASGALSIALKGNNGSDPSATNPVVVPFRNATATDGDVASITLTAGVVLTLPSGATMGVASSKAFRLWIVGFNDGGTFRLGAINCLEHTANSSMTIFPLDEAALTSAVSVSTGSDSAGVFYAGATITSKAMRVLGYLEWSLSGLTAGTWTTTNLNKIQAMSSGMKLPGDIIRRQSIQTSTEKSTSSATPQIVDGLSIAWVMNSAANLLWSGVNGNALAGATGTASHVGVYAAGVLVGQDAAGYNSAGAVISFCAIQQYSKPNSVSSITYDVRVSAAEGTVNFPETTSIAGYGIFELQEIMT